MKRLLSLCLFLCSIYTLKAQIPNFGTTVGNDKLYGYSCMKYRANANVWETYSTLQYGISDYFQAGVDLYISGSNSYMGYIARVGYKFSDHFKLGAQLTPSFDLERHHKFSYLTSAIYINGNITSDGRLFYVTDTWLENVKDKLISAKQWTYLGYTAPLGKSGNNSITPMVGAIHSWKFNQDVDLSMGFYFTHKNINLYAWTNDILTNHPRFIIAIEFAFKN